MRSLPDGISFLLRRGGLMIPSEAGKLLGYASRGIFLKYYLRTYLDIGVNINFGIPRLSLMYTRKASCGISYNGLAWVEYAICLFPVTPQTLYWPVKPLFMPSSSMHTRKPFGFARCGRRTFSKRKMRGMTIIFSSKCTLSDKIRKEESRNHKMIYLTVSHDFSCVSEPQDMP